MIPDFPNDTGLPSYLSEPPPIKRSRYCPPLYLNYMCWPGPYISRLKLTTQPGVAVGGSVPTVLAQIVGQSLSSGVFQAKLTHQLTEILEKAKLPNRQDWQPMHIKAKRKKGSVHGDVLAPLYKEDVSVFMAYLNKVLQCCPNLWTYSRQPHCPYNCKQSAREGIRQDVRRAVVSGGSSRSLIGSSNLDGEDDLDYEEYKENNNVDRVKLCTSPTPNYPDESTLYEEDNNNNANEPTSKEDRLLNTPTNNNSGAIRFHDDSQNSSNNRSDKGAYDANQYNPAKRQKTKTRSYRIPIADVLSDPLLWSIDEVCEYVANDETVCHFAPWMKREYIDGQALMLLDLQTLVTGLRMPHEALLPLAHFVMRLKMAHVVNYAHDPSN